MGSYQTQPGPDAVRPVQLTATQSDAATAARALEQSVDKEDYSCDVVDFENETDSQNPKNWRKGYKWMLVVLMSGTSLAV